MRAIAGALTVPERIASEIIALARAYTGCQSESYIMQQR
jgi:hypothetical protein